MNVDAVNVFLGKGDDNFTIDTTAPTINADDGLQTLTVVEGGGGSNTIDVTASSDPLVLYGNESASGVEYNSAPGAITGNAYSFTTFGSDTINASGATGTVVIVGGPKNDAADGRLGRELDRRRPRRRHDHGAGRAELRLWRLELHGWGAGPVARWRFPDD